jgi:hypothetical protein
MLLRQNKVAPRTRLIRSPRFVKTLELVSASTPVFKTGAVVQAWLPRLRVATVGNPF